MNSHSNSSSTYDSLVERAIWEVEQAERHLMGLVTQTDRWLSQEGWFLFDPKDSPSLQAAADWLVRTGRGVRDAGGKAVWVHTGPGTRAGAVSALEDMLAEVLACAAPLDWAGDGMLILSSGESPAMARAMTLLAARGRARIVRHGTDGSVSVSMPDPGPGPESK